MRFFCYLQLLILCHVCPVIFGKLSETILLTWCLINETYAFDTQSGSVQNSSQCGFNFEEENRHPSGFLGITLDGASYPYVDLNIPKLTNLTSAFSFSFDVKPMFVDGGCVFHYKSDVGSPNKITEMKFWLNNSKIVTSFTTNGNPDDVLVSNQLLVADWNFIAIGLDMVQREYYIYYDVSFINQGWKNTYIYPPTTLETPGKIRLGSCWDDVGILSGRFRGSIFGLNLYSELIKFSDKSKVILQCTEKTNWKHQPSGLPPSSLECPGQFQQGTFKGVFKKVVDEQSPNPLLYTAIVTLQVRRPILCGAECQKVTSCISFTVQTIEFLKVVCNLYASDVKDFQPAKYVKYYILA